KATDLYLGEQASATYYSYDIHGNVDTLVQDYKNSIMAEKNNRFKKLVYKYDLISGKVDMVAYEPGKIDAFYHRYGYDAENRLVNVLTSRDSIHWDKDAFYQYYKHGALARKVIGQQHVQGIDYAYTLQGWLKAANPILSATGFNYNRADGTSNSIVAKDEYRFALNYFNHDYAGIGTGVDSLSGKMNQYLQSDHRSLYNGNISSMAVNIEQFKQPLLYNYKYDQLNRLVQMDSWKSDTGWNSLSHVNDFKERISYDANGNVLNYIRNGNNTFAGKPLGMDSLVYHYNANTNQLNYVHDDVAAGNYTEDIDNQNADNYTYDAIGNLTKDVKESIDSIYWTVYGKIDSITKKDGTGIKYNYDATGNRIRKAVTKDGITRYTNYVRDASGNTMAIYEAGNSNLNSGVLTQTEVNLYGSSRLGTLTTNMNVQQIIPVSKINLSGLGDAGYICDFVRGKKQYELSNHLGNVLVTVSDKKKLMESPLNNGGCDAGTGLDILTVGNRD
ncbi:MAG: hypothetical protein HY305_06115, partial [Sphingobacteriales bacterium]|nr:hypothetical protein [Sphingobacteriales bacterium]